MSKKKDVKETPILKVIDEDDDDYDRREKDLLIQDWGFAGRYFVINIDEDIAEPKVYRKAFHLLDTASSNDIVKIRINTYGGLIHTANEFCNYLLATPAKTIGEIHTAISAGSMIAFHCDELVVCDYATIMIHACSYGDAGKVHEIKAQSDFAEKEQKDRFMRTYTGFLTDKEIEEVIKGRDIWLYEDEIKKRVKKWTPMRKRADWSSS
jgi:ATP-dependent protease ClpP protease subunit